MSPILPEKPEGPKAIQERFKVALNTAQLIQLLLSALLGLSTITLMCGFRGTVAFLQRYSDVAVYNVSAGHYFAVGFVILFNALIIPTTLLSLGGLVYLTRARNVISKVGHYVARKYVRPVKKAGDFVYGSFESARVDENRTTVSLHLIVSGIGVFFITYLWAYSAYYGENLLVSLYFTSADRREPPSVALILKENYPPSSLMLSTDDLNPNLTKPLWLLAELTDGLLVADLNTKRVVAVKNEVIASIIDDQLSESLPDPTPTFTPTLTFTPTATPTATFTPVPTETATP